MAVLVRFDLTRSFAISTSSILLYFEITKSFLILNMVYLNKPDINIKSKMATINLHTGRDKVSFCVYFDFLNYNHYCRQNLYFMIL